MPPFARLLLLLLAASGLTSCGTASHLLGQAGGLIHSVTSPVLGAIRLSDTPDYSPAPPVQGASHDPRRTPPQRPD